MFHSQPDYAQQQQQSDMQSGSHMMQQPRDMSNWDELDDFENMTNEMDVEPDYYIDRAPDAIFIPQEKGKDKQTQVQDRIDPELFNFDVEVMPILQVLVGKSLELARIECIEEHERNEREEAMKVYKRNREAHLVHTQRLEARRTRLEQEFDRRWLRAKVQRSVQIREEQIAIARGITQDFLRALKHEKLEELGA